MRVIVIGGGAAGLMAAYSAAENADVTLIEKNEKLGKKLYITGKGRCNLTNGCDKTEFFSNVVNNPKFLMSAVNAFSPSDFMELLQDNGLELKTERGNRVFPSSDKASDVTKTLEKMCFSRGVTIYLNEQVKNISVTNGCVTSVITDKRSIPCDAAIIATGGLSYSSTGSNGDGYKFAASLGHTVVKPSSALVGIELKGDYCRALMGVSLKNVRLTAKRGEKLLRSEFGEMLFTHFGISGPIALTLSSYICREDLNNIRLYLDLKPAISDDMLDKRILRDFEALKNRALKNSLDMLLLKSLVPIIIERAGISPEKNNNSITASERAALISAIKRFELKVLSLRPIEEAIITSGGVAVSEINPKTMESKLIRGLFFAGEVIDVDALTGGFNIQTAVSTGFAAGRYASISDKK